MKARAKLARILTPPPLPPNNLLASSSLSATVASALHAQLAGSQPSAAPRAWLTKIQGTTRLHEHWVAYIVVADTSKSIPPPPAIVIQNVYTGHVVMNLSLGEIASLVFDYDVLSKASESQQAKIMRDFGHVQGVAFVDHASLYWSGLGAGKTSPESSMSWQYMIVQVPNRFVVLNFTELSRTRPHPVTSASSTGPRVILGQYSPVGSTISSNVVPLSKYWVLFATKDGLLQVYDWKKKSVVQTFSPSSSKSDYACYICLANSYKTLDSVHDEGLRRCVVLTKKEYAYLVEFRIENHATACTFVGVRARFEGGGVPVSMSKTEEEQHQSAWEHVYARYDATRDLFLWCSPSKTKARVLAFSLGNLDEPDAKQKRKSEPVKAEATLVTQFPYEISHTIFPGWVMDGIPMESVTCAAVTKDGELQLFVAPVANTASSLKHPFAAVTIFHLRLPDIMQRDLQGIDSAAVESSFHLRVQSISSYCPHDPGTFLVTTSVGILVLQLLDSNIVPFPGSRHAHFPANYGSMGKSVLTIKHSEIRYANLVDTKAANTLAAASSPLGTSDTISLLQKTSTVVYESPPPLHLPPEIHKRPVRLAPYFLPSPSQTFICCYWKEELRYEILHVPTLMQKVQQSSTTSMVPVSASPVVASGHGVTSVAWVGDSDVFALLYNPEQDLALQVGIDTLSATTAASLGKDLAHAASKITDVRKLKELTKLKELASLKTVKSSANKVVGTASKLKSLKGLQDLANTASKATVGTVKGTVKKGAKVTMGTAKLTGKVAVGTVKGATKVTMGTAKTTTHLAKEGTNKVVGSAAKVGKVAIGGAKKTAHVATFGLLKRKSKADPQESQDQDDDEQSRMTTLTSISAADSSLPTESEGMSEQFGSAERNYPWVELRALIGRSADSNPSEGSASVSVSNLGELSLRSGKRNPPTMLFGGPVLCVACRTDEDDEGLAYFYTRKESDEQVGAKSYVSSGPALPCPNYVAWDEDGRLCAIVIDSYVAVYLSEAPEFLLLGSKRLVESSSPESRVTSVTWVHGVLFCTTSSTVQCILLGDLKGGICMLDSYVLADSSSRCALVSNPFDTYQGLAPQSRSMPLFSPCVLGYHNGSILLSTMTGLAAISLSHPLLRIGCLLSSGHIGRAEKWLEAFPESDHEALVTFLERRGVPEMGLSLSGISLETSVDICMKYGLVDRLEGLVEKYGVVGLHLLDMGRGVSAGIFGAEEEPVSVLVAAGAFLLAHGKVDVVRRLASECLSSRDGSSRDGLILASLLLAIPGSDAKRVVSRAVADADSSTWLLGTTVRDILLDH